MAKPPASDRAPARPPVRAPHRACPICGGDRVERLHTQRFVLPEAHPLPAAYDVVCCDACGFVYADTPAGQPEYDAYYSRDSKYADVNTGTGGGDLPWDDARLRDTARTIAAHVVGRTGLAVDVGCGNGGLLKWLAREGFTALAGVDPSPECARAVERVAGVRGRVGWLSHLPDDVLGAELGILSHVLEHVLDLRAATGALARLVRPGGRAYVEVPDATRFHAFVAAPFQDFNVEHINHFSPASLRNLLGAAGFTVEATGRTVVAASADVPYPALWAVAEHTGRHAPPVRDDELRPAVERYIAASRALVAEFDARLRAQLGGAPEVVVWGTGQTVRQLLSTTCLADVRIAAFADGNAANQGKRLAGAPVLAPEALAEFPPYPLVVGSVVSQSAIVARARALGLRNPPVLLAPEPPPALQPDP